MSERKSIWRRLGYLDGYQPPKDVKKNRPGRRPDVIHKPFYDPWTYDEENPPLRTFDRDNRPKNWGV